MLDQDTLLINDILLYLAMLNDLRNRDDPPPNDDDYAFDSDAQDIGSLFG